MFRDAPKNTAPAIVGKTTTFDPAKLLLHGSVYSWDFGDNSPAKTSRRLDPLVTHTYKEPGNYKVKVEVKDPDGNVETYTFNQTVTYPILERPPLHSSNIIGDSKYVYAVNPDSGTVAAIDKETLKRVWEVPVGKDPRTLTTDSWGAIWVAVRGDDKISRIDPRTLTVKDFDVAPVK